MLVFSSELKPEYLSCVIILSLYSISEIIVFIMHSIFKLLWNSYIITWTWLLHRAVKYGIGNQFKRLSFNRPVSKVWKIRRHFVKVLHVFTVSKTQGTKFFNLLSFDILFLLFFALLLQIYIVYHILLFPYHNIVNSLKKLAGKLDM